MGINAWHIFTCTLSEWAISVCNVHLCVLDWRDFLLVVCLRDETKSRCLHQHTYTTPKTRFRCVLNILPLSAIKGKVSGLSAQRLKFQLCSLRSLQVTAGSYFRTRSSRSSSTETVQTALVGTASSSHLKDRLHLAVSLLTARRPRLDLEALSSPVFLSLWVSASV